MQKPTESHGLNRPPSTDKLARSIAELGFSHRICVLAAKEAIAQLKSVVGAPFLSYKELARQLAERIHVGSYRHVINMSGVILHTGLGRAVLCEEAVQAMQRAGGHISLEYDMETGKRGDRQQGVRSALLELTGAEDCLVVNNCAGATMLVLRTLCKDKEVILSRSQMVEIGGHFRMPDIIEEAGARLVEVGCTNRTRISDYEKALTENTGAILHCHPSNYRIIGHTEQPDCSALAEVAHKNGCLFIDDLGHGCLIDMTQFGLPAERTMKQAIADGADIVMASGDKLIGGPQAGIILGKNSLIKKIAQHPMSRALRIDKLSLIALERTLNLFLEARTSEIPLYAALSRPEILLKSFAKRISESYSGESVVEIKLTEVGGGTMPGRGVETWCVGLKSDSSQALYHELLKMPIPVVGRIENGIVWLDPRACSEPEIEQVVKFLTSKQK